MANALAFQDPRLQQPAPPDSMVRMPEPAAPAAPMPTPMAAPKPSPSYGGGNPFRPEAKPAKFQMLGNALNSFQRGFDPKGWQADQDKAKADKLDGLKKQIKDAVRAHNLDVERLYEASFSVYKVAADKHSLEMERIRSAAETLRQQALSEMATLRVRE